MFLLHTDSFPGHLRHLRLPIALLIGLALSLSSCAGGSQQHSADAPPYPPEPQFTPSEFVMFRGEQFPAAPTPARRNLLQRYRRFYGIQPGRHTHSAGFVTADLPGRDLFLQGFTAPDPAGTIVLLHGYLEHSGNLAPFTNLFLDAGWNVFTADLPGHGLSEGERGWIADFGDYAAALELVLKRLGEPATLAADMGAAGTAGTGTMASALNPGTLPLVLLGHSTGGAAILEHLFQRSDPGVDSETTSIPLPDRILLAAPLVRSTFWELSRIGITLADPLPLERVRGSARAGTQTPYYLRMARIDPLRVEYTHLDWVRAMIRWNERNLAYTPLDIPAVVLQGTEDSVLDVEYNLAYLEEHLTNAEIHILEGAHHNLHHETEPRQTEILQLLRESLP